MIKVANRKVIKDLAKRDYINNKKRNVLSVIAILLTTFMLTALCSLGSGYWNAIMDRSVRMEGMKYDVRLPQPTEEQVKKASGMNSVLYAGVSVKCAIIEKYETDTHKIRLFYSDETNWEKQCAPAFEFVLGSYPDNENEVMLSAQTLKQLGITTPQIGMGLPMTYHPLAGVDEEEPLKKEFRLSGYYRDYSGDAKGFVSKDFYHKTGAKQTDLTQGYLNITLRNHVYTPKDILSLQDELVMGKGQMIYADYNLSGDFFKFAAGLTGLFSLVFKSGFLFIYNILSISVAKEIRFFGQLKLIGTTSAQMRMFIYRQVLMNALLGIPPGLLLGGLASFWVVPAVLYSMNPTLGIVQEMPFHAGIFVGAGLFSFLTVFIGSRQPVVIAGNISPVEASKYIGVKLGRSSMSVSMKRTNGGKLSGMAWRNLFRNKKQAAVIFASFFLALTTFLSVIILVRGNSAANVLNTLFDYDCRIKNTIVLDEPFSQVIQSAELERIASLEGVATVRKVTSARMITSNGEALLNPYLMRLFEIPVIASSLGSTYEEAIMSSENNEECELRTGRLVGVDEAGFEALNKKMGGVVEKGDFMSGKTGIIQTNFGASARETLGQELSFRLPDNAQEQQYSIKITATYEDGKNPNFFSSGYGPNIIVSEHFARKVIEKPVTELVDVNYTEAFNSVLDRNIKDIFSSSEKIVLESKLDDFEEMKQSEDRMKVLGTGLWMIVALLALLNYCNMITASIQNRRQEFLTLQNIGMTSVQLRKVLVLEGIGYGVLSALSTAILGIPISYLVFQSMNRYQTSFTIPVWESVTVLAIMMFLCMSVPLIALRLMARQCQEGAHS